MDLCMLKTLDFTTGTREGFEYKQHRVGLYFRKTPGSDMGMLWGEQM